MVPNFSDGLLNGSLYGIGLAVDPAGKFLYTLWSGSGNLAVLSVAADCSLSLVKSPIPQPDTAVSLAVSHNGKVLVVSYPDIGGAQAYSTSSSGSLTAVGPQLVFANVIPACATAGCYPADVDVTDDGRYSVWGNSTLSGPSTLSAELTPKGFTNAALETYPSAPQNVELPWFSPAAAETGVGNLYVSASGFGSGFPAGIIVATFNKGTITYASDVTNSADNYAGGVQTIGTKGTGSPLVQIGANSSGQTTLYSYTVNGTTLTAVGSLLNPTPGFAPDIVAFPARP